MAYHAKIIAGGKVVIPADLRRELGFMDGDSVIFEREQGTLTLKSYSQVVREVQANFKAMIKDPFTVDEFISDRRAEALRE